MLSLHRVQQSIRTLIDKDSWGLTGWAQVNGRDELSIPDKVKLDAEYLQRQSLWFDIRILWLTFVKVLRRDGGVALMKRLLIVGAGRHGCSVAEAVLAGLAMPFDIAISSLSGLSAEASHGTSYRSQY
jgi:hypothetical protein